YPAYVATGLFVWFYLTDVVTLSVTLFEREKSYIKGTTLPLSIYVLRLTAETAMRAGYALAGCLAILWIAGTPVAAAWLWAVLGLAVVVAIAPAAIVVFAFLGAYFPDSQFIVANLMRIGMFLTPIFWAPGAVGGLQDAFYAVNPFTHFIEIVRQPILGHGLPTDSLGLCLAIGFGLWCLAAMCIGRLGK